MFSLPARFLFFKLYIKIGQVFVNKKLTCDSPIEAPFYVTFTLIFSNSTVEPNTASQPKTIILCVTAAERPTNLPRETPPELLLLNMNELIAKSLPFLTLDFVFYLFKKTAFATP